MNVRLLFCVAAILAVAVPAQPAPADATIRDACATLSRNARDAKARGVIQAVAAESAMPAAMRSRAMVLHALPFLQQMNTNQFDRIVQVLLSTYPEEGAAILGLTERDWLATCPACNGDGTKTATCPSCARTGKCPSCKGAKKTPSGAACQACKGAGACGRCGGAKEIPTACLECKGSGKVVVLSANIARRYEHVLAELGVLASQNVQFAEQSQKALAVRDVKERLAALEEVIAAFPNRQDLGALTAACEEAQGRIAAELAQKQAQDEHSRMAQERDTLFAAAARLPHSSIPVLIRQIDAFTAQYPKSGYGVELEVLKSKLQSRHTIYTNAWRGFYILGGLIAVLFVLSQAKDWIFGKNRKESLSKLSGMEKLNADEFTDPLSDARKAAVMRKANDDVGVHPK